MMTTHFLNVGHGEAILIETHAFGNQRWIVRDFGRSRFAKHTDFSMSIPRLLSRDCCCCYPLHILKHCCYHMPPYPEKLDAVLSHAHEDHFNGFKALYDQGCRNIFENAFIPMFRMNDLNALGGVLIKYSIFLYRYYGPSTQIGANAKNWLLAAPVLAGLAKNLWCVNAGHQVTSWGQPNIILWPPVQEDLSQRLSEKLNQYLVKNNLPEDYLNQESEPIRNLLSEFYTVQGENNEGHTFESKQVENFISEVEKVLEMGIEKSEQLSNPIGLSNSAFKPTLDNHSLIFAIGEAEEEYLCLSDADDKTVGAMLQHNTINNKKYKIIKAGHHGNRGAEALDAHMVTSDEVIVSCGPAHSNWKGPCTSYRLISQDITCTDWNDSSKNWANKSQFKINQSCCVRR